MTELLRGQSMKDSPRAAKGTVLHGLSPRSLATLQLALAVGVSLTAAERGTVKPWGKKGEYAGFEIVAGGRVTARVAFVAARCAVAQTSDTDVKGGPALRFTGFESRCGLEVSPKSFFAVGWDADAQEHELRWRLAVKGFDPAKWGKAMGRVPFHFVRMHLPTTHLVFFLARSPWPSDQLYHIGGWHIPTPGLDKYPLYGGAVGYGRQVASRWSRDWTFAPPFAALPLATAGLWSPRTKRYVAFDLNAVRVAGDTMPGMGAAGLWQNGKPFMALVWPAAQPYQTLKYPPSAVFELNGRCHLLVRTDVPPDDDPNRLVHQFIWSKLQRRLPAVRPSIDIAWMPKQRHFECFPRREQPPLVEHVKEPEWFQAGSSTFTRDRTWGPAYTPGTAPGHGLLATEMFFLISSTLQGRTRGDEPYYCYADPPEGQRLSLFGVGSASCHTDASWFVGLLALDVGMRDRELPDYFLTIADRVLRFTEHMAYTRASRPDAPACQSARAIAAGVHFCLAYHHSFSADASRRDLAKLALRLARTLAYRYLTVWPCDNDSSDQVDPTFMLQGNGGLSWLGTAGGEETWRFVAPLIETYVATGDPVLGQYARGMVDRLSQLLTPDGKIMCVAVADGAPVDRATWRPEPIVGDLEQLIWPVGNATLRVVVGQKGMLVFHKGTPTIRAAAYRHGPEGFAFRLSDVAEEPRPDAFDIAVTHPYWELHGRTVLRVRAQQSDQPKCTAFAERPDTVCIRDVRVGDEIVVGDVPEDAPIIAAAPLKAREGGSRRPGLASVLRPPTPPKAKLSELEPLMKRFSGQIAVLPDPTRPNPLASRVGSMLRRVGLDEYLSPISAQQLIDPSYFSAKTFPIAMYLGNERYHQTVKQEGDGDRALVQFLRDGGTLLVLPTGTWAFFQNQAGKTIINCHTFGFCTAGHGPGDLGPHATGAVTRGFERPPKQHTLTFHVRPDQRIVKSLPSTFPYPRPGTVDLRWRPTVDKLSIPRKYTPLITLCDESGRSWSEGAALVELSEPPFQNARVLSVWFSLLRMRGIGESLLYDVLRYALTTTKPARTPSRLAALPFNDDFSAYKQGAAPGAPWQPLAGKWRIENGSLVGEDCSCKGYEAAGIFCGSNRWRNYELSLRFRVESKGADWKDGPWIGVRTNTQHDGYHLNFTHRGTQLHKVTHGVSTNERRPLAQAKWTYGDKWHTLTVRAVANRIRVQIDDQLLFDYRDDMALDFPSLREGGISLSARKWPRFRGRVTVRFDDVKVTPLP